MKTHSGQEGQVLIILVAALFMGGSAAATLGQFATGKSAKELKAAIGEFNLGGDREARVKRVMETGEEDGKHYAKSTDKLRSHLIALSKQYGTTREQFEAVFNEINTAADQLGVRFIEARFALKEELSQAQWQQLFAEKEQTKS